MKSDLTLETRLKEIGEKYNNLEASRDFETLISDAFGGMNDNLTAEDGCSYIWKEFVKPLRDIAVEQAKELKECYAYIDSQAQEIEILKNQIRNGDAVLIARMKEIYQLGEKIEQLTRHISILINQAKLQKEEIDRLNEVHKLIVDRLTRFIPVAERLPDFSRWLIVQLKKAEGNEPRYGIAWLRGDGLWFSGNGEVKVTGWREI